MNSESLPNNATTRVVEEQRGIRPGDGFSLLTDEDLILFNQGSHSRAYEKLGAHRLTRDGVEGTYFAVWAPAAEKVFVTGTFNNWDKESDPLEPRGNSGIWEGFIAGVNKGALYKYFIHSRFMGQRLEKADPFSIFNEIPPRTASIVWDLEYLWNDRTWMADRRSRNCARCADFDL